MTLKLVELKPKANPDVVRAAEDILENAKNGTYKDLAYIATTQAGETITFFTKTDDGFRRLGQVYRLAHRMNINFDDHETISDLDHPA